MPKGRATWPQSVGCLVVGLAAVVLVLAVSWVLFVPVADWLAHHDVGSVTGPLHETALDNARSRLLTLGAGLFAAGALVFTARNFALSRRTFELTEQGQVTDRYSKAIEQLGSDKLDVRVGGIYALERVGRDSATDYPTVMEVLTAFVREHSHEQWPLPRPEGAAPERSTRPDVQAALTVIGRRDAIRDRRSVDLAGVCMARADLTSADLTYANLTSTDLTGAFLRMADLTGANLTEANLTEANLTGMDLTRARLTGANLTEANLTGANLTDAHLTGARLTRADLNHANLTRANFTEADLTRANLPFVRNDTGSRGATPIGAMLARLTDADLTGPKFSGAILNGADLTGADLSRADLTRANLTDVMFGEDFDLPPDLTGANLTDADLTGARWPELWARNHIPEGWKLNPDSGQLQRADIGSVSEH